MPDRHAVEVISLLYTLAIVPSHSCAFISPLSFTPHTPPSPSLTLPLPSHSLPSSLITHLLPHHSSPPSSTPPPPPSPLSSLPSNPALPPPSLLPPHTLPFPSPHPAIPLPSPCHSPPLTHSFTCRDGCGLSDYISEEGVCEDCHPLCEQCVGPGPSNCTSCQDSR